MKILYTAHATATNGGRGGGRSATDNGKVSVNLSVPKEMGGDGGAGTNPEELFATGYAACFLGAMHVAAGRDKQKLPEGTTVSAKISFADRQDNVGFTVVPELTAHIPGYDKAKAEALVQKAHAICPYSNLITTVHDVKLNVA